LSLRNALGRACEHVGDRAFGNLQAEQALQHLGQARVADHLAAVKIGDERDDAGAERRAGRHVRGRLGGDGIAAARTIGAAQVDPRRACGAKLPAADQVLARAYDHVELPPIKPVAALGVDIARHVGVGRQHGLRRSTVRVRFFWLA
jgi:hypothetical protein